jgi:hypothetical protein
MFLPGRFVIPRGPASVRAVKREKPGPSNAALRRATRTSLFDRLVGEFLKMQWHIEAERLCGLQIYHYLELAL